ncbi:MAG: major capsid protein [Nitrospiraceae bacterium]|nr:major capsid protein [Nitrospiraceae bacterium]
MPPVRSLHIDQALTNLSIKYSNQAMIWPLALPLIPVNKRSDKYFVYNKEDAYTLADDTVFPKAFPNEMDWGTSTGNYSVTDHAFADWLPEEVIENADVPLQPEVDTNDYLNLLLDIAQEQRVANIVFNAASYAAGNSVTLSGTSQWSSANATPIEDIQNAIESCFGPDGRANTLVFGVDTWKALRSHPQILDAVKAATRLQAAGGGLASRDEVATLFEVDQILVGRGRYNTAKQGQNPTFARLWGKHAAALYVEKAPGIRSITFGATFCETRRQTQRDFDVKRGVKGAHYLKVVWNSAEVVIAGDCGYFIQNATA